MVRKPRWRTRDIRSLIYPRYGYPWCTRPSTQALLYLVPSKYLFLSSSRAHSSEITFFLYNPRWKFALQTEISGKYFFVFFLSFFYHSSFRKDHFTVLSLKFGTQDFTDPSLLYIRRTPTGLSLWFRLNKCFWYPAVIPFVSYIGVYHKWYSFLAVLVSWKQILSIRVSNGYLFQWNHTSVQTYFCLKNLWIN